MKTIPCKEIAAYIAEVRSGAYPVCREQLLLCDYVERCFAEEDLHVDLIQLSKYLSLQKYFPYRLFGWEIFCFALHNCTYRPDGSLRWPDLLVLVGRGAGKNGYLSFEDFCLLTDFNGIRMYHIDICANAEDQARTSFDDIYNVLKDNEKKLKSHFTWTKELITNIKTGSQLRFRTSNAKSKDGGRPGKVDFDEYHEYENYRLLQVFRTGLGKKAHPRTTITTTNGYVRGGPLDDTIAAAEQILNGLISDNGLLPFICKLDSEAELDNPAMWGKANPSLRFFPELQRIIAKEYIDFKRDPIGNSSFAVKRMNVPIGRKDVEVTSWENILATNRPVPDLKGCTCAGGIDYAKTTDFVTAGLLFKHTGRLYWLTHTWVCNRCNDLGRIKAPLLEWEKAGLLTFVDGPEVPPDLPAGWMQQQARFYDIQRIGIDNYRYTLLAKALREVGFDTDKGGRNNIKLTRPSDEMKFAPLIGSALVNQEVIWGDNPLMRWYLNNSCMITSAAGNTTYGKIEPQSRKTDGWKAFVAAVIAGGDDMPDNGAGDDFAFGVYTY